MKSKTLILLVLSLFVCNMSRSQSIFGHVEDLAGTPIPIAVAILQTSDSTFIEAVTSDSLGMFVFQKSVFPYRIIIRHLAYKKKILTGSQPNFGKIVLEDNTNELGEITIKEDVPIVQLKADGAMNFNARTITLHKPISSAIDLLDAIPLIQKTSSGYEVLGTMTVATIILNGKQSKMTVQQLQTMLESMPPDQVRNIEVFYDTPPKYGVKGPSINVVLEKKRSNNNLARGDVFATMRQRFYFGGTGGTNWSLSGKNWSAYAAYSLSKNKIRSLNELSALHLLNDTIFNVSQTTTSIDKALNHNANVLFEIDINDATIELQYSGILSDNKIKSTSDLSVDTLPIKSIKKTNGYDKTHSISVEFSKNDFSIGGSYLYYKFSNQQNVNNSDNSTIGSNSYQKVQNFEFYADNENGFSIGNISYGVEGKCIRTTNTYDEQSFNRANNTNTEQIEYELSAYVGWNQKISKGALNISCAVEWQKATEKNGMQNLILWNKFIATPQLTFIYTITPTQMLRVSVTSDKKYPSYWKTTNSISYSNPYLSINGNSDLKPYVSYELSANYIIRGKYIIGVFENYCPDFFTQLLYQQADTLHAYYKHYNFEYRNTLGLSGVLPINWSENVNSRLTIVPMQIIDKGSYEGINFSRSKWGGIITLTNNFILNNAKTLSAQLSGRIQMPTIQGLYNLETMYNVSAKLVWQPNQKWKIDLSGNDLFNNNMRGNVAQCEQNYKMHIWLDRQNVQLTIRYLFNEFKSKHFRDIDSSRLGIQ